MKKLICSLMCAVLITGCGAGTPRRAKTIVLEQDEFNYTVKIDKDVISPYSTIKKTLSYIDAPPQEIRDALKKQLETDGYSQGGASRVKVEASDKDPNITYKITLSTESGTPEEAKETGASLAALTRIFYPEQADQILYELNVYGENKSVTQIYRTVICGNIKFEYNSAGNFKITAADIPSEKDAVYAPAKPK